MTCPVSFTSIEPLDPLQLGKIFTMQASNMLKKIHWIEG
jgi:hypothetical protein